jgi:hypothetical protein
MHVHPTTQPTLRQVSRIQLRYASRLSPTTPETSGVPDNQPAAKLDDVSATRFDQIKRLNQSVAMELVIRIEKDQPLSSRFFDQSNSRIKRAPIGKTFHQCDS